MTHKKEKYVMTVLCENKTKKVTKSMEMVINTHVLSKQKGMFMLAEDILTTPEHGKFTFEEEETH